MKDFFRSGAGRHFRPPADFGHAANSNYSAAGPRFAHGSGTLWDEVTKRQGNVDFYTACTFLESHAGNLFARNPSIRDPRTRQSLKELGFETVINLYDAVAERPMSDNSKYLDLLNSSIELSKAELASWTLPIKAFYAESNKPYLEKKWQEAKAAGTISPREDSFARTMAACFDNPQIVSQGGYARRQALLQFISDAYSDFVGEPRVAITLIGGPASLGGYHTVDERSGRHVIGINVNNFAFQLNFQTIMNVLNHERYHASDRMLGEKYRAGAIDPASPHYKRARIAAAAMGQNGYISNNAEAGPLAYRDQIIEVTAHHAGKLAEYWTHATFAREPDPVLGVRGQPSRDALDSEYEAMARGRVYRDNLAPPGMKRVALDYSTPAP